jgi:hypothetical protein
MGKLDWRVVGFALGSFLAVSYVICVAYDLAFDQRMYEAWLKLLPGFTWLTWPSFRSDWPKHSSTASISVLCSSRYTTFSLTCFPGALPGNHHDTAFASCHRDRRMSQQRCFKLKGA